MKRILVIEDDDSLKENLTEIFTNEGFRVTTAADGKSGGSR